MIEIPLPLRVEHEELHTQLRKATQAGGEVGDAAQALAKLMHPHFVKEDEFALPSCPPCSPNTGRSSLRSIA